MSGFSSRPQQGEYCALLGILPNVADVGTAGTDMARKYCSAVSARVTAYGDHHEVEVPITYEIELRHSYAKKDGCFDQAAWFKDIKSAGGCGAERYPTPDGVRSCLAGHKLRSVSTPSWLHFNFDGIVAVLTGMLAMMTVKPKMSTKDFRGGKRYAVKGITQMEDLYAINDRAAIFLDPFFAPDSRNEAAWTFITAANICGAQVVMPYVDCDGNGAPLCREVAGPALIRGITLCLNLLGSYYSMVSLGDVFAMWCVRGAHRILSVVAHADEGGAMRDVLRKGSFCPPFGGLCANLPITAGLPLCDALHSAGHVHYIDSILLGSAALVAHCDPMVTIGDRLYPTVITIPNVEKEDGTVKTEAEVAAEMAVTFVGLLSRFAPNYVRAITKLFGLMCDSCLHSEKMIASISFVTTNTVPRHLAFSQLAPFFWIEPTTIIAKDYLGTAAERGGSGALVTPGEKAVMPMFEGYGALDTEEVVMSDWALGYRSARTCGFALYTANHPSDGLACCQLKAFDSSLVVLGKIGYEDIVAAKNARGFIFLSDLMWTRGQSKLPHPAEALYTGDVIGATIVHQVVGPQGTLQKKRHIPRATDLTATVVTLTAVRPTYVGVSKACKESAQVSRKRSRGAHALERACFESWATARKHSSQLVASEATGFLRIACRQDGSATTSLGPRDWNEGTLTTGEPLPSAEPDKTAGATVPVARQHGVVVTPQPRALAVGPPVVVQPGGRPPTVDGGQAPTGPVPAAGGDGGVVGGAVAQSPAQAAANQPAAAGRA